MNARARFVITFSPAPHVNAIRSLRRLLKDAKRRFGLVAVDAYEDRSSPLEISNRAADEFKALRSEIIAERASHGPPAADSTITENKSPSASSMQHSADHS